MNVRSKALSSCSREVRVRHAYLGSISVLACIGHADDSGSSVLQVKVLVVELGAPDGLSSSAVTASEISLLKSAITGNF